MRLEFQRTLPCPADRAFCLLTEPRRMNTWSTAQIEARAPGDGGHASSIGALRTVTLPRGAGRLEEVVIACEPPRRFVYRVLRGAPVRHHEGTITLTPQGSRTHLRWTVDLSFPLPGMGRVARRLLVPELERSLDTLVAVAPAAADGSLPQPCEVVDDDVLDRLFADAESIRAAQQARADAYQADDDVRYWFTRVYAHVTDLQIEGCRAGDYQHPGWVLRLIPPFHRYYEQALDAFDRGDRAETHWAHALAASARLDRHRVNRFQAAVHAIFQGMRAHIEDDLPRTLAEVYLRHYRGRCDYVRFRGDYLVMGPVFRHAGDRLLAELSFRDKPLRYHVIDAVLPDLLKDWWTARSFYDIPKRRRQAFDLGERLARFVEARHDAMSG